MITKERFVRFFKNLINFKFSNTVGDVNLTTDTSITGLEQLLMKVYLISISPEAMNGQQPINQRRFRIGLVIKWLFVIQTIRSILYFYAKYWFQDQLILDIIGDYLAVIGVGGDVLHFWNAVFGD